MLRLALRNVFRQRTRSALTLAAIMFGVVGLLLSGGFVHDMFDKLAEAIIHSQTGHVQLAKAGFFTRGFRAPEKYVVPDPQALAERIARLPQVADITARVQFSGLLNNGRTNLSIHGEGIEPGKEARLATHLVIKEGRSLADADRFGALLGEGVARALKLAPGDRIALLTSSVEGAMNTLDFEVVGVFQSLSKDYDARAVKISLPAAQELLNTRGANVLVVSLHQTADTTAVASQLRALTAADDLEVKGWHELNDFYPKTVALYERQFGVLQLIILVLVLLSVVNSVNMSLFERVGEFGTMRVLGDTSRRVCAVLIAEGLALGVAGSALGIVLGVAVALGISAVGIPMPPPPNSNLGYVAEIRLVPAVVAAAFFTGVAATILASILPAVRASRMPIAEALKQNV
jgi:putative ABC transport system permease protein